MISKDYNWYREQVLNLYKDYVNTFESFGEEVNQSIIKTADKIKDKKFNLMVLGEAKSGKSTFINAYLGKEILPMDVKQCTSSIIKINYGDKFKLVAKTAAGGQTTIDNSDEIIEFLKIHASIDDKYRNIPVPTINNELLIKYGRQGKEISDEEIKQFTNAVVKDNIYGISIEEYNEAIKNYIKEKAGNWEKIITEIDITYKLPKKMKDITIIDSPGIGAGGNFGEISEEYIEKADAIIFVKYLPGQALESKQFMSLIRSNVSEKQKEFLFLVFTGKSDLSEIDLTKLKKQAIEMYNNDIEEEKILFIDSKIQLFLNKCLELKTSEKIDEFFENLEKEGNNFASAENCWLKSKLDVRKFVDSMIEKSDFRSVKIAIEKFAQKANYLSLKGLIENIKKEYNRYKSITSEKKKIAEKSKNDPIELGNAIKLKEIEMDKLLGLINEDIKKINQKYMDNIRGEGFVFKLLKNIIDKYKKKLDGYLNMTKNQITEETFNELKKMRMDINEEVKDLQDKIRNDVIKDCNNALENYKDKMPDISIEAYIPNFTDTDFDEMYKSAEYESWEQVYILWIIPLWWKDYNKEKHLKKLILGDDNYNGIYKELLDIINKMSDTILDNISKEYIPKYEKKLLENIEKSKSEYNKLLKIKDDNDKIIAQIESWKKNLSIVELKIKEIEELKGEIENYVR